MSALSERLVKQLLRIRDRELELEAKQQELANKVKQGEELRKEMETEQEKLAKLKSVQDTLEKMNEESEVKYKAVQDDDEQQRKQISETLKKSIADAEEVSRDLAQREDRAKARKELLLKQKEIYDQHFSSGKEKFDELSAKRETETSELAKKTEANRLRAPELKARLDTETEQLASAKTEEAELRTKVDVFLARFAELREQLHEAKKVYDSASTDKDRNTRTLKALDSDLDMLRRRAAASKAERNKELVKVTALEEKAEAVRNQISTFESVTRMLTAAAPAGERKSDATASA